MILLEYDNDHLIKEISLINRIITWLMKNAGMYCEVLKGNSGPIGEYISILLITICFLHSVINFFFPYTIWDKILCSDGDHFKKLFQLPFSV